MADELPTRVEEYHPVRICTGNMKRRGVKTSHQDIVMASAGGYRNIQIGREVWDPPKVRVCFSRCNY